MAEFSTLTLRPSKLRLLGLLLITVIFTFGGFLMIRENKPADGWYPWGITCFFGLGVLVLLIQLLPGATYLRLTPEGFEICSLFRISRLAWRDVKEFCVYKQNLNTFVGFSFVDEYDRAQFGRLISRSVSDVFGSSIVEGMLPDCYGMKAADLAQLLNDWRSNFAGQPD
jgi:hypothetical protein